MTLPGMAAIPAPLARRLRLAEAAGRRIVEMAREDLRPSRILTRPAFENAVRLLMALGGSTNAVVHLPAIAGPAGHPARSRRLRPLRADDADGGDVRPSGKYHMEDLAEAGGIPAVMKELAPLLHLDASDGDRQTLGANLEASGAGCVAGGDHAARPAVQAEGGLAILRATSPPTARSSSCRPPRRRCSGTAAGPASSATWTTSRPGSTTRPRRHAGQRARPPERRPGGRPGMPEAGSLPIPKKLLAAGVRDMVRISDARMSGTAGGTVVLHVAPEAAVGGPLALVRDGDEILLDTEARRLDLLVADAELARRRPAWRPPAAPRPRLPAAFRRSGSSRRRGLRLRLPRTAGRSNRASRDAPRSVAHHVTRAVVPRSTGRGGHDPVHPPRSRPAPRRARRGRRSSRRSPPPPAPRPGRAARRRPRRGPRWRPRERAIGA